MGILIDFTITFNTHYVRVKKYEDGKIRCFKYIIPRGKVYNERKIRCSIETFTCEYAAGEYAATKFTKMINIVDD